VRRRSGGAGRGIVLPSRGQRVTAGALVCINEVLNANANIIGGNFRLLFDGDTLFSRWLTEFCAWIRLLGHYYGEVTRGSLFVVRCMTLSADFARYQ
jgi:hypothetical protein